MLIFRKKMCQMCMRYIFVLKIVWDIYELEIVSLGELVVSGILFRFETWLVGY